MGIEQSQDNVKDIVDLHKKTGHAHEIKKEIRSEYLKNFHRKDKMEDAEKEQIRDAIKTKIKSYVAALEDITESNKGIAQKRVDNDVVWRFYESIHNTNVWKDASTTTNTKLYSRMLLQRGRIDYS